MERKINMTFFISHFSVNFFNLALKMLHYYRTCIELARIVIKYHNIYRLFVF